jgi:signal recognition particle receptor subunit beta
MSAAMLGRETDLGEIKLIFTGSVGAGKTTAIAAISEVAPIRTEVAAPGLRYKETTTVALDYGELSLGTGQKLRLYGTPGQRRYDFMAPVLARGALGLVVLVDAAGPEPLDDLGYYLDLFAPLITATAVVVGITHVDRAQGPSLEDYQAVVARRGIACPVLPADVRERDQVVLLVEALIAMLEYA